MQNLQEIIVDEEGVITLNDAILENVFPILSPFYFNGQGYPYFNDKKCLPWQAEMQDQAPNNAKFYSVSNGSGMYMNGMEPYHFTKAFVQFYGQRKSD